MINWKNLLIETLAVLQAAERDSTPDKVNDWWKQKLETGAELYAAACKSLEDVAADLAEPSGFEE
ncbi:hypothetical protein COT48_05290 [Candidatus Woesearchaeota archaeon CG08_land_8_20_14_0_20_47_9]|nr:MAG: hypothetical protein AUJ69_00850 [Candidatus Woesearchaeota archaeon CG1_02_47_18]PIN72984.1 MAG: hypothetical protein COV22_01765 [Candidatus Woesearchaeota archaeon CG10_big_fil_rev_8_21_14_0_10_47_5]PIO03349.1 MAG: hypothetical protein COT48_05290 [Candidatus Woesearchaeota archaeon CG08_land_8_20_14_0_20_47_9]HII29672.1 hypothetical protein [Candidatus Woesearchaeota archaeon]